MIDHFAAQIGMRLGKNHMSFRCVDVLKCYLCGDVGVIHGYHYGNTLENARQSFHQ